MAVCPQCGNPLDQDFGVVSCSQCLAVLFIDMDGNVHFNAADTPVENNPSPSYPPPAIEEDFSAPPSGEPAAADFNDNWMDPQNGSVPAEGSFVAEPLSSPPEEVVVEGTNEEPLEESPVENIPEESPAPIAPNDFSDVESFANSDSTVGALSYSVTIEDINTKEVRAELKEALTDEKFQWDVSEILREIKGGKLVLKDLNPVKASVLIQRMRDLRVKISWRQNIYG